MDALRGSHVVLLQDPIQILDVLWQFAQVQLGKSRISLNVLKIDATLLLVALLYLLQLGDVVVQVLELNGSLQLWNILSREIWCVHRDISWLDLLARGQPRRK